MTALTTTPQVRLPVPRWMWLAAGAVVALGTLYLALYPLTLAWPAAAYLAIGQLHTLAFAVSAVLLALLSCSLPERGSRWAARALLLSSLLAIGLDLQQRSQGREITEPAGIIVYILVYLLNVVAVNCMFPRHQWHWRMALRRFSEVGIVMCVVYAGQGELQPRLIPGWAWSPELTLACFRFVSTIGLATSALIIYRRYFVAGRPAIVWGAIGLACMLYALNAIDHDRGAVSITLRSETDVMVEVRDNGCGMDESQLAVIRDRFAAIEQGEIPDSTGIGLNLCKRLIDAHGGRFTLRSALGTGTTVTFVLGRSPGPPEPAAPRRQPTGDPS